MTVGYVRVSTTEQAESGAGLDAQRSAIAQICEAKGLVLDGIKEDVGVSGGSLTTDRLALGALLPQLRPGDRLVIARLDRLGRVTSDVAGLVERAAAERWGLVVADMDVDSSTPVGRLVLSILSSVAAFERDLIRERTAEALAARRRAGVRTGRSPSLPDPVRQHIFVLRQAGATLQRIADELNGQKVPTAQGGKKWWPATVAGVLRSVELDVELAESLARHDGLTPSDQR